MKLTLIRTARETGKETFSTWPSDTLMEKMKTENKAGHISALRSLIPHITGSNGHYPCIDKLPRICPAAEYARSKEGERYLKTYNGLVQIEVNHLANAVEVEQVKRQAALLPQTFAAFCGSSGRSVKIWVLFATPDGSRPRQEEKIRLFHTAAYRLAVNCYQPLLPYPVTLKEPAVEQSCRMTLDDYEGGCYAKVINLDKESEPDIYAAIKRDALLENVTVAADGKIDFADKSVTENTRVSYPIYHINNIVKPVSKGPHAHQVIFLSADAFGVLPPVSILNPEQAQYYFLSGFTAKLAGTERGITEPTPTFSACFGAAFLSLHPTKYAEELVKKMNKVGAKAYLVNTGWNGSGKRISIKDTRGIIDAILDGSIDKAPTKVIPFFDFVVPTELPNVDPKILDPRDTYECACQWEEKAKDLAGRFIKNFAKFTGNEAGKALVAAGPKL